MTTRIVSSVLVAALAAAGPALAQTPSPAPAPPAPRYVDPVNGLSLEQAIARALAQEPSLRAARSGIDAARGLRVQASLRPNPSVSFEHRDEPAGADDQTAVAVEWPLDLFRRSRRVAVADREITAVQWAVADRERLLTAEVRMRYGDVLATARDLAVVDELVATTQRQHELLRSRVEEGATPPLDRDVLDVELRRLESDRLLLVGRTEAALVHLKRALGMRADGTLSVRDTLEDVVRREGAPPGLITTGSVALAERADVQEAAARVAVAEARIDRAESEGRFDVSLVAGYMRMDAGFPQRGVTPGGSLEPIRGTFHYVSGGATITLPVLNRNQGDVAAARAEHAGAASAYEAARLAADAELAAARSMDEQARLAVRAYGGADTLARQNLAVVGQSYELGRMTVFDVLAEQRRYLDLQRAYTEAMRAAYEARTALNLALGGVR